MNKLIAFLLVFAPAFVYAQSQWGTYQIKDELTGKSTSVTAFKSKLGFTNYPESKIQVKVECQLDGDYVDGIIYTLTTFNAPQLPKVKDGENIFFRSVLQSDEEAKFAWLGTEYKNQLMSYTAFYTSDALALNSLLTKGQIEKDLKVNSFEDIKKVLPKKIEILFADGNKFIVDFTSKEYNDLVSKCYADYKKSDKFLKRKQKEAKLDKERILEEEQKKIRKQKDIEESVQRKIQEEKRFAQEQKEALEWEIEQEIDAQIRKDQREKKEAYERKLEERRKKYGEETEKNYNLGKEFTQDLAKEVRAKLKGPNKIISLSIQVVTYAPQVFEDIKEHEELIYVAWVELLKKIREEKIPELEDKNSFEEFINAIGSKFTEDANKVLVDKLGYAGIERIKITKTKIFNQ